VRPLAVIMLHANERVSQNPACRLGEVGGGACPYVAAAANDPSNAHAVVSALTPRQREILDGLAQGLSNKQVARRLGVSPNTVKVHLAALFRTLNANNRTQAVMFAQRRGLLSGAPSSLNGEGGLSLSEWLP